jgi:hypothetical protein
MEKIGLGGGILIFPIDNFSGSAPGFYLRKGGVQIQEHSGSVGRFAPRRVYLVFCSPGVHILRETAVTMAALEPCKE